MPEFQGDPFKDLVHLYICVRIERLAARNGGYLIQNACPCKPTAVDWS
ncbi:MAG: hypothetical protein M9893_11735 [Pyrinomonadaceae bacterium]|nr:hypothetical protein [Pyrinomonadaceae bacterium]